MAIFLKILLKQIPVLFVVILTSLNGVLLTPNQRANVTNNFHQNFNVTNNNNNSSKQLLLNATNNVRQNYNVIQLFSVAKPYQKSDVTDTFSQNSNVRNNGTQLNATNNVQQNNSTATNNVSQHLNAPNVFQNSARFSNVTNNAIHLSNVTNNVTHHANVTNVVPNVTDILHAANVTNVVPNVTDILHAANVTNNVKNHFPNVNVAANVTHHSDNVSQNLNAGNNNNIIKNVAQHLNVTNTATRRENNTTHQLVDVTTNNVTDKAHQNVSHVEQRLRDVKIAENASVPTAASENATKDLTNMFVSTATVVDNNNRKSKNIEDNFSQNLSANKNISPATLLNDTAISANQSSPFAASVETTTLSGVYVSVVKHETLTITTTTTKPMVEVTPTTTKMQAGVTLATIKTPEKPRKSGRPSLIQRLMMNSRTMAPGSNAGRSATTPEVIYDDGLLQMFDIGEVPAIPTTTKVAMPSFYDATPPAWLLQQMAASTGSGMQAPKVFEITLPPLLSGNEGSAAGNNNENNEELVENASESSGHHGIPVEATNSIIISGIICGCAIVFFSILMALCIWRQNKSRRPIYPPNSTMLPTTSLTSINSQKPVGLFQRI